MEENPYSPPVSDIESLAQPEAEFLIPWEDHARYPRLWDRLSATMSCLMHPSEAGKALGGSRAIAPGLSFMSLVGMPLMWISQIVVAVFGPANPMLGIFRLFGLPEPPAPPPAAQSMQHLMQIITAIALPLTITISLCIWSLAAHGGLWLTQALRPGKGLETTFRTILYSSSAIFLVTWIFSLWVFLPPIAALLLLTISTLGWIGFCVYQGVLLAKAHETETWRGVLGFFAPWLLLLFCCGGFGLFAALMMGAASMHH